MHIAYHYIFLPLQDISTVSDYNRRPMAGRYDLPSVSFSGHRIYDHCVGQNGWIHLCLKGKLISALGYVALWPCDVMAEVYFIMCKHLQSLWSVVII